MTITTRTGATLALALMGALSAQSALACKAPLVPKALPDGRTATLQVMQEARLEVTQYVEQVDTYFQCENDALKLQEVSELKSAVLNRFNSAVFVFMKANRIATARTVGHTSR